MSAADLRLVVFDVDGTLIDSRVEIVAALTEAFETSGRAAPEPASIMALVGLGLSEVVARLAPDGSPAAVEALALQCQKTFYDRRRRGDEAPSPLFPGARAALDRLAAEDPLLLGIATGKPRRGLDHVFEVHGLSATFHTSRTVSEAASKPAPDMVLGCMDDVGVDARATIVVGDTSFDVEMARAAGAQAVGVTWGSHDAETLWAAGAAAVIDRFDALDAALDEVWRAA